MASLEPVYRKMRRAEKDLNVLRAELVSFDAQEANYTITEHVDPQDGARVFTFHQLRHPDPEWEITMGEVAYQIRSGLDQLVTQLVVLNGGDPDKHRGSFPIFDNAQDYRQKTIRPRGGGPKLNKRDIALAGVSDPAKRIIDALQPYHRGRRWMVFLDPLYVLNAACVGDKHRYGHPAQFVLRSSALAHFDDAAKAITIYGRNWHAPEDLLEDRGKPIDDSTEFFRLGGSGDTAGLPGHVPVNVRHGFFRIGVAFGPMRLFVFDLEAILRYVEERVVARFQPFFEAP